MVGRKVVLLGSALPAVVLVAHGCRTATQVTLEVSTNVACADSRGVEIVVAETPHDAEVRAVLLTPGAKRYPTATTNECASDRSPHRVGTLVITPSGSGGAVVVVTSFGKTPVETCLAGSFAKECIVARRAFTFVDHTQVTLPVLLDPDCAGIPCDEGSTCFGQKCVDSHVTCESGTCDDPGKLAPPPPPDGSTPPPAPFDAGTDGDARADGDAEAGAPPGACMCLDNSFCTGGTMCCYENGLVSCKPSGACTDIAACCRNATDCADPQDVCCADTDSPTPATRIACAPHGSCYNVPGHHPVCSETGGGGCGFPGDTRMCIGPWNTTPPPAFFACS
jgi:hypothetical protein